MHGRRDGRRRDEVLSAHREIRATHARAAGKRDLLGVDREIELVRGARGEPRCRGARARRICEQRGDPRFEGRTDRARPLLGRCRGVLRLRDPRVNQLGEHDPERVEIGSRGGGLASSYLGREIARRTACRGAAGDHRGEPHVDERRAALLGAIPPRSVARDEHIGRLDIAMPHAERMQLVERTTDPMRDDRRELSPLVDAEASRRRERRTGAPRRRHVASTGAQRGGGRRNATGIEEGRTPAAPNAGEQRCLAADPVLVVARHLERGHDPVALGAVDLRRRPDPYALADAPEARLDRQLWCRREADALHPHILADPGRTSTSLTPRSARSERRPSLHPARAVSTLVVHEQDAQRSPR